MKNLKSIKKIYLLLSLLSFTKNTIFAMESDKEQSELKDNISQVIKLNP